MAKSRMRDNPPKLFLPEAAKACYEGFLRELGIEKHASVVDWDKLPVVIRERWARVAQTTYDAMTGA